MKKICFVNYDMTVTGGVEQVTTSLANAFCAEYEVFLFAVFGKGRKVPFDLDSRIHYHAELSGDCRIRQRITKCFRPLRRLIKENKIDVVFLMENHPALVASPVRFCTKAKYVFCDHGALMNEWEKKDITFFRFWDSWISHKTVTLTEQNRQDYMKKFHTNPKKIQSIYNWIAPHVIDSRQEYRADSKQIITVGRMSEEKGYDMLLEVAKKVLPDNPDWQWHLYGSGDCFAWVEAEIKKSGLEDQIILKGNVKNAYRYYAEYAFLVLPSYREGLPLVLLEAKACGLPMVSFDVTTGPREIIRDGKDGYLIPPYQLDVMAERIQSLMRNREKRIAFSEQTADNLDKFQKEKIYQEWKELIEKLTK